MHSSILHMYLYILTLQGLLAKAKSYHTSLKSTKSRLKKLKESTCTETSFESTDTGALTAAATASKAQSTAPNGNNNSSTSTANYGSREEKQLAEEEEEAKTGDREAEGSSSVNINSSQRQRDSPLSSCSEDKASIITTGSSAGESTSSGGSIGSGSGSGSDHKGSPMHVHMVITPYGPELATSNCEGLSQQYHQLMRRLEPLLKELGSTAAVLGNDCVVLGQFYSSYDDLRVWLAATKGRLHAYGNTSSSSADWQHGLATAHPQRPIGKEEVLARKPQMDSLQSLATEVLLLPAEEEERKELEGRLSTLYREWDELYQQVRTYVLYMYVIMSYVHVHA